MALNILASAVAPILLTVSFAGAVVTTVTSRWVTRTNWSLDDPPVNQGQLFRSPFVNCGSVLVNPPNGSTPYYIVDCFRSKIPGRSCSSFGGDYPALCQQLDFTGCLLIVGCVFIGLAFLLSWLLLSARIFFPHHWHHHHRRRLNHDTSAENAAATAFRSWTSVAALQSSITLAVFVFAVIAAASLAIAQLIGGNALLNLQPPNGEFSNTAQATDIRAGWTWDVGVAYAGVSWILAAFGAFAVDVVWELPRGAGGYELVATANNHAEDDGRGED
jgi:hypothetical protein